MSKKLLMDMIKEFYPYAQKQLGFNHPAKIILKNDVENAKNPLGKTAYYEPDSMSVSVFITNRHPKDILRSISHELVHHMQNCNGVLQNSEHATEEGYAQKDPHLRNMEKEAYEKGNIIFRDWEDQRKSKQQMVNEMKEKEVDPLKREKANDHYVDRAATVFKELTERWGFVQKPKEEEKENENKD
jgi:hypothetical protein